MSLLITKKYIPGTGKGARIITRTKDYLQINVYYYDDQSIFELRQPPADDDVIRSGTGTILFSRYYCCTLYGSKKYSSVGMCWPKMSYSNNYVITFSIAADGV